MAMSDSVVARAAFSSAEVESIARFEMYRDEAFGHGRFCFDD